VFEAEAETLLEEAKAAVRDALTQPPEDGTVDFEVLRKNARRALGRLISERTRRRPAVIPVIMEV
jgi:ribonuclease J